MAWALPMQHLLKMKLTACREKLNRATDCVCVKKRNHIIVCVSAYVCETLLSQKLLQQPTYTHLLQILKVDMKYGPNHVLMCFSCLSLIKYKNLRQYLTNTISISHSNPSCFAFCFSSAFLFPPVLHAPLCFRY